MKKLLNKYLDFKQLDNLIFSNFNALYSFFKVNT